MSEQLRVEHVLRNGAAVEGLEDGLRPFGIRVNQTREHFLARARLAGEQDRDRGRRDAAGRGKQVLHLLGEKQRARFGLDRIRRPKRGSVTILTTQTVECCGGLGDSQHVRDKNRLCGVSRNFERQT